MPLARSLAMRYRRQTESLDDLVQVAGLGLVKAVDRLRSRATSAAFAAYAVPTILGELRRHFRDHVWNVRLPRGLAGADDEGRRGDRRPDRGARPLPDPDRDRASARRSRSRTCSRRSRPATRAGPCRSTRRAVRTTTRRPERARPLGGADAGYDRVEAQLASVTRRARRARVGRCCGCASSTSSPSRRSASGSASPRCRSRESAGRRCGSCSRRSAARTTAARCPASSRAAREAVPTPSSARHGPGTGGARRVVRRASRWRAPPRPRRGCRTGPRPGRSR